MLASFARREQSAATRDGLNISTVDTAKMLLARLKEEKKTALEAQLDEALKKLPPELLRLPDYERVGPGGSNRGHRRSGRRGRGRRRQRPDR